MAHLKVLWGSLSRGERAISSGFFPMPNAHSISYQAMNFEGAFGVVGEVKGTTEYLFLGRGKKIAEHGFSITATTGRATAVLSKCRDRWCFTSDEPVTVTFPRIHGKTSLHFMRDKQLVKLAGKEVTIGGGRAVAFELSAAAFTQIDVEDFPAAAAVLFRFAG